MKCLYNNDSDIIEMYTIKQTLTEHASQLKRDNLDFIIKTLDGDEDKWKAIQSECAALLEKVKSLEGELKERVIGDQTEFKPSTINTKIEDICGTLGQGTFESTILSNNKMNHDLVTLCKLSGKRFKLIYRATRHGFQASAFHDKCDHQPRTLTIVKTTMGYIFGGYNSVAWDSISGWKVDPKSFLFSLVSAYSVPLLMPMKAGEAQSIWCDASYGPVFGPDVSITISNNSNATMESYSNLGKGYDFTPFAYGTTHAQSFLAGSRNFQTSEIEVFQLN